MQGGIASGHGNYKTTVRNCYNTGNIQGSRAGGILGTNGNIIENCYNTGKISSNQYAGGITGDGATEIINCYNVGNITGDGRLGGICVKAYSKIINCYNAGNLYHTSILNGASNGGIANTNESNVIISNCFNVGKSTAVGRFAGPAAGILGSNSGTATISNCYSIHEVEVKTGNGQGIVGSNSGTVTLNKCYYLKSTNIPFAIASQEDDTLQVTALTSASEITAEILNANITTITHEDEWKAWKAGEKGYPVFE